MGKRFHLSVWVWFFDVYRLGGLGQSMVGGVAKENNGGRGLLFVVFRNYYQVGGWCSGWVVGLVGGLFYLHKK